MNFGDIAERYGTFSLGFVALIFTAVQIYLAFNKDDYDTQESFFLFTMPSGKSAYFACLGDRR
jgi:hypothetical protein